MMYLTIWCFDTNIKENMLNWCPIKYKRPGTDWQWGFMDPILIIKDSNRSARYYSILKGDVNSNFKIYGFNGNVNIVF